uniref:Uncharacterized protein n=1 Tax=Burkholderia cenocepacia TaxID=95486 RepID=A0A071MNP1_9BURK
MSLDIITRSDKHNPSHINCPRVRHFGSTDHLNLNRQISIIAIAKYFLLIKYVVTLHGTYISTTTTIIICSNMPQIPQLLKHLQ